MSGRPRPLVLVTAALVPCNGRLGVILSLSTLFFGQAAMVLLI